MNGTVVRLTKLRRGALWMVLMFVASTGFLAPLAGASGASEASGRTADNDNDFASATQLTSGVKVQGEVNDTDDTVDYFKIDVKSGQFIKTNLTYTNSSNFIFVSTYDQNQVTIAQTLVGTTLLAIFNGTYYVSVTTWSGTDTYDLTVTVEYPPTLLPGSTINANLNDSSAENRLFYRIWLDGNISGTGRAEGCWVNMSELDPSTDFDLSFTDILNYQKAEAYNLSWYADPSESVSMVASYTGWYYLMADGFSGSGDITLKPTKFTTGSDGNNDYANATAVKHNGVVSGARVDQGWDHFDWYKYHVFADDTMRVRVDRTSGTDIFNLSIYSDSMDFIDGGYNYNPQTQQTTTFVSINVPAAQADTSYRIHVSALRPFGASVQGDETAVVGYTLSFTSTNHLPGVISSLEDISMPEETDTSYNLSSHFRDIDGDKLYYNFSGLTNIVGTFTPSTGMLKIAPKDNWYGKETLTVAVDDGFGGVVSLTQNITVTYVNHLPYVKKPIPNIQMLQGGTDTSIDLSKVFDDKDIAWGEKLNYSVEGNGSIWVTIQPNGAVKLYDPVTFFGSQSMTFIATDNESVTARAPCNVTVVHVNQPPHVDKRPGNMTVNEDETAVVDLSKAFVDPEGDPITLTPSGMTRMLVTVDTMSLVATFKPLKDMSGFFEDIKFTATDEQGAGDEYVVVRVTVMTVNDRPVFKNSFPSGEVTLTELESQEFSANATDIDSSSLNYTWYLDDKDQRVAENTWTYLTTYDSAGNHTVKLVVDDGDLEVTRVWNVTVINKNRDPLLKVASPKTGTAFPQGSQVEFEATATDPDKDKLSYSWLEGKTELSDQLSFSTSSLRPGNHNILLVVSDGTTEVKSKPIVITVEANKAPVIVGYTPPLGQSFEKGKKITFSVNVRNDEATDTLTFSWSEQGKVLSTAQQFETSDLKVGIHTILLSAYDGFTYTNATVTVEVTNPPAAPGMSRGTLLAMVGIVAVITVVAVLAVLMMRRKKPAAAAPAGQVDASATAVVQAPQAQPEQQYQPYPSGFEQPAAPAYDYGAYQQPPAPQQYDQGAYQPPAQGEPGVPSEEAYQQQPAWAMAPPSEPGGGNTLVAADEPMSAEPVPSSEEPAPEASLAEAPPGSTPDQAPPEGTPMPEARPDAEPKEPQP